METTWWWWWWWWWSFMHFNDPYQPHHIMNNLFIIYFLIFLTYTWLGSSVFIYLIFFKGVKFRQFEEYSREYSVVIFPFFYFKKTQNFLRGFFFFLGFGKVISTLDSDFNLLPFFQPFFKNLFRQVLKNMLTF